MISRGELLSFPTGFQVQLYNAASSVPQEGGSSTQIKRELWLGMT